MIMRMSPCWACLFGVGAACISVSASEGVSPLFGPSPAYYFHHGKTTTTTTFARKSSDNSRFWEVSRRNRGCDSPLCFHDERLRLQQVFSSQLRGGAVITTITSVSPPDFKSFMIQPEAVVSAAALFYVAQGACIFLAPERFCNALGIPNFCMGRLLMRMLGNAMLHGGILMACIHFWHVNDIATVIAISSIVFVMESLTEFLNQEPKKIGYKINLQVLNFLIHCCIMVLGFYNETSSYLLTEILPFYAVYVIVVLAMPMILVPRLWTRIVGFDIVDSKELYCVEAIGWLLANSGIIIAALSNGVDSVKSVGYGSIALLVLNLRYTLEFVNLGGGGGGVHWRCLNVLISTALTAGTLLLKS